MILYCDDCQVEFDTDHDLEEHRFCHDTAGIRFTNDERTEDDDDE